MTQSYIYEIRPNRPGLIENMTEREQALMAEHFSYLKAMLDRGKLLIAGPCEDAAFGIVVFYADSVAAAHAIMESDPAVREKVMRAELHPFRVSLIAGNVISK